jgi:predicted transcriptional regulator
VPTLDEIMQKVRTAAENPYAPMPAVEEIHSMLMTTAPPDFYSFRESVLVRAPESARNFYYNIRTPQGSEYWTKIMLRYPKLAERIIGVMSKWIPFIEPVSEMVAENEYNAKMHEHKIKTFGNALDLFNALHQRRERMLATEAEDIASALEVMTLGNAADMWRGIQRFYGTPVYNKLVTAYTANLARAYTQALPVLSLSPYEDERVVAEGAIKTLREILPPNVMEVAVTASKNAETFRNLLTGVLEGEVSELEKLQQTLSSMGISEPRIDAALIRARETITALKQFRFGSLDEFLKMRDQAKGAIDNIRQAFTPAMARAQNFATSVQKAITGVLSMLNRLPASTAKELLSNIRQMSHFVGGRTIAKILADEKGIVTHESKIQILDELDEIVKRWQEFAVNTGLFPADTFIALRLQIAGMKSAYSALDAATKKILEMVNSDEFKEVLSDKRLQLLAERRKQQKFPLEYEKLLLELRAKKFQQETGNPLSLLFKFFNTTTQYIRTLASLSRKNMKTVLGDQEELQVISRLLRSMEIASRPEVMQVFAGTPIEGLQDHLRNKAEELTVKLSELHNKAKEGTIKDEEVAEFQEELKKLVSVANNVWNAILQKLSSAGIFPTPEQVAQQGVSQGAPPPVTIVVSPSPASETRKSERVDILEDPIGGARLSFGDGEQRRRQVDEQVVRQVVEQRSRQAEGQRSIQGQQQQRQVTSKPKTTTPPKDQKSLWQRFVEFIMQKPGGKKIVPQKFEERKRVVIQRRTRREGE